MCLCVCVQSILRVKRNVHMLQSVAVCCSVLQCVAVCCSALASREKSLSNMYTYIQNVPRAIFVIAMRVYPRAIFVIAMRVYEMLSLREHAQFNNVMYVMECVAVC